MAIEYILNEETGDSCRAKLNALIDAVNRAPQVLAEYNGADYTSTDTISLNGPFSEYRRITIEIYELVGSGELRLLINGGTEPHRYAMTRIGVAGDQRGNASYAPLFWSGAGTTIANGIHGIVEIMTNRGGLGGNTIAYKGQLCWRDYAGNTTSSGIVTTGIIDDSGMDTPINQLDLMLSAGTFSSGHIRILGHDPYPVV